MTGILLGTVGKANCEQKSVGWTSVCYQNTTSKVHLLGYDLNVFVTVISELLRDKQLLRDRQLQKLIVKRLRKQNLNTEK